MKIIKLDTSYLQNKLLINKISKDMANEKELISVESQIQEIEVTITKELGANWKGDDNLVKIETTWESNNNQVLDYLCFRVRVVALWVKAAQGYVVISSKHSDYYIGQVIE